MLKLDFVSVAYTLSLCVMKIIPFDVSNTSIPTARENVVGSLVLS